MVHRPPAQHFQPEVMNTDSMDLVRMSVKHDVRREMTEIAKKIQNEGTGLTETSGEDCPVAPRFARLNRVVDRNRKQPFNQ